MTTLARADHIMSTYKRFPVEFVSGASSTLFDADGRSYLDLTAGIAVASVGHAHPKVVAAISEQAGKLIHVSNLYRTQPQAELSNRLADLTGGMSSFFGNSGAEAIEAAIKLARKYGRGLDPSKVRIVAAEGGFHGRTYGALSATGQPKKKESFEPVVPGFTHVPFDDGDALQEAMGPDVAAVLLEPIQGEGGVVVPSPSYLHSARALCDHYDALLILDEIQTGLGRTGAWFAHAHWNVSPDVMCLAKALAGGLPMGACLATSEVAEIFEVGDHASTFGGGPVQSAAALATLSVIEEEGLVERARVAGERFAAGLSDVFGANSEIRGRGLLIGVELPSPRAADVVKCALEHRVLVNNATDMVVRIAPPLVITDAEIDRALETLVEVWDEVSTS